MFATFLSIPAFRRLAAAILCSVPASSAFAGNVHTVGGTGGSYPDIQSAVAAASAGDTILVRSGIYAGFVIDNGSLAVVADTGATVQLNSRVVIRNLEAGRKVVLAGLRFDVWADPAPSALHLVGNAGSVRVQSCAIAGDAVQSSQSDDVAFVGCTLQSPEGVMAMRVFGGKVALYDCNLLGGSGQAGGDGAPGCTLDQGAFLFASGTTFQGGNGGDGTGNGDCFEPPPTDGGNGGDGIRGQASVRLVLQDCLAYGGIGGAGGIDNCPPYDDGLPGADGLSINLDASSTLEEPPVWARRLVMPTPVRETSPIHVTLTGQPGELAYLTMWGNTRFLYSPGYSGVLLEKAPLIRRVRLGVVPASGVLDRDIALPDLGPGVQAKTYYFQAYFLDGSSVVTLGSPAFAVTLDSAF